MPMISFPSRTRVTSAIEAQKQSKLPLVLLPDVMIEYPLNLEHGDYATSFDLTALLLDQRQLDGLISPLKGVLDGLNIRVSPVRFWASTP